MDENKEPTTAEDEDVEAHLLGNEERGNEERAGNEEPDVEGHLLLGNEFVEGNE